ncbi:hypothetical protein EI555_000659, partial [Monodon monoceros]
MPKRKVRSTQGSAKEEPKGRAAPEKGKQAKVAKQETKEDGPAENGETTSKESPASPTKQQRKKPSLINIIHPQGESSLPDEAAEKEAESDGLISGPCLPSCVLQRNALINYFVNASFLVALETFLRRRESHLIPFLR